MIENKQVVFLLTYCEADFWIQTYPADKFNSEYKDYKFIVLDNGSQDAMAEWCKETNSIYYASEYNIGSTGGYNWIFRVADLLDCKRAVLLQSDVEILDREKTLDVLFDDRFNDYEIPFWPQTQRSEWDEINIGQVYNLGQFFSFNPKMILSEGFINDENYVVTHYDDADLARRMRDNGVTLSNMLLDYPDFDVNRGPVDDEFSASHFVGNLYNIHHISSSTSDNHRDWEEYNMDYWNRKWIREYGGGWPGPFGLDSSRYNYMEPHSKRWTHLGYPPYPVEHEVNRFWREYHNM